MAITEIMKKLYGTLHSRGKKYSDILSEIVRTPVLKNSGYCPICAQKVTFIARDAWLREHYRCSNCGSIPRERSLMLTIDMYFPNWRSMTIHESSPCNRGASMRLSQNCSKYIPSQFFLNQTSGSMVDNLRCENLEALSFADESIDLHITQDVLEHVFHPSKVFSEIARTLRTGGAHIFTVPIANKCNPSKLRARVGDDGQISHIEPPVYHGNPISDEGSLVTVDWGYDICRHIFESCGLFTHIVNINDPSKGIRGECLEVLITFKPDTAGTHNSIP